MKGVLISIPISFLLWLLIIWTATEAFGDELIPCSGVYIYKKDIAQCKDCYDCLTIIRGREVEPLIREPKTNTSTTATSKKKTSATYPRGKSRPVEIRRGREGTK